MNFNLEISVDGNKGLEEIKTVVYWYSEIVLFHQNYYVDKLVPIFLLWSTSILIPSFCHFIKSFFTNNLLTLKPQLYLWVEKYGCLPGLGVPSAPITALVQFLGLSEFVVPEFSEKKNKIHIFQIIF